MKRCASCGIDYPDDANYCVNCGRPPERLPPGRAPRAARAGWKVFALTLGGSLLLSWMLIAVFHLPIFILGAFLPLFWSWGRKG